MLWTSVYPHGLTNSRTALTYKTHWHFSSAAKRSTKSKKNWPSYLHFKKVKFNELTLKSLEILQDIPNIYFKLVSWYAMLANAFMATFLFDMLPNFDFENIKMMKGWWLQKQWIVANCGTPKIQLSVVVIPIGAKATKGVPNQPIVSWGSQSDPADADMVPKIREVLESEFHINATGLEFTFQNQYRVGTPPPLPTTPAPVAPAPAPRRTWSRSTPIGLPIRYGWRGNCSHAVVELIKTSWFNFAICFIFMSVIRSR